MIIIVHRPGTIMLWRKGDRVLTAGDIKVTLSSLAKLLFNIIFPYICIYMYMYVRQKYTGGNVNFSNVVSDNS